MYTKKTHQKIHNYTRTLYTNITTVLFQNIVSFDGFIRKTSFRPSLSICRPALRYKIHHYKFYNHFFSLSKSRQRMIEFIGQSCCGDSGVGSGQTFVGDEID